MADTVTSSSSLLIETAFVDGDTRTVTLKNPTDDISTNQISELNSFLLSSQILLGDRDNAAFSKIKQVRTRTTTTSILDISG